MTPVVLFMEDAPLQALLTEALAAYQPETGIVVCKTINDIPASGEAGILLCDDETAAQASAIHGKLTGHYCLVLSRDAAEEERRMAGFSYMALPVRLGDILERLQKIQGKIKAAMPDSIAMGPYELHLAECIVTGADGTDIRLTEKERDILWHLYSMPGRTADKSRLLEEVWGYNDTVETHTLETHIYRLRQKIETDLVAPRILVTSGNGYKLEN